MLLYLVRHALTTVRPDIPGALWHLAPEGRAAAEALAAEPWWDELEAIYASPEPKAAGTAQRIVAGSDVPLRIERNLCEVEREGWLAERYAEAARRYLTGERIEGWEPREHAAARIVNCIDAIAARHEGDLAIVSHGLALTLYVVSLAAGDAFELWSQLRMPDVAVVDAGARQVVQRFGEAAAMADRRKETS